MILTNWHFLIKLHVLSMDNTNRWLL